MMMRVLVFLLISSWISCDLRYHHPKIYSIPNEKNKEINVIKLVNGQSVYLTIEKLCRNEMNINKFQCLLIATKIHNDYYSIPYSPSCVRSTIEDYYSNRFDLVNYLQMRFHPISSLEITWDDDQRYDIIQWKYETETDIGVDSIDEITFKMMSNEFFRQNDQHFDLIILHTDHKSAEQVWNDILNSLKTLNEGGTIVLYNLLVLESIENFQESWKAAIAMRLLPDYEIIVVDIDGGCGIIRKRPNTHHLPESWHRALVQMGPLPGKTLLGTHSLTLNDLQLNLDTLYRLMSLVEMREWLEE